MFFKSNKINYTLAFLLLFFVPLSSCKKKQKLNLTVFAAASMTETLNKIKPLFEKENKNINVVYNFDSSGTLKTQIIQGADCDIFLSAAQKQMNELENKNLLIANTRENLLENKTVIAVKKGGESKVSSFADLAEKLKNKKIFIAIGNSDVPVGQYTKKIFDYYKIDEKAIASQLTYASNVKEVTTQVSQGSVEAGIIYATDATSAGLVKIAYATIDETGGRVIYPIAILKGTNNKSSAEKFIEFLKTPAATRIFEDVGFVSAI